MLIILSFSAGVLLKISKELKMKTLITLLNILLLAIVISCSSQPGTSGGSSGGGNNASSLSSQNPEVQAWEARHPPNHPEVQVLFQAALHPAPVFQAVLFMLPKQATIITREQKQAR